MPSPEGFQGGPPEPAPHRQEQEPLPYHRVARFADDQTAARVYAQAQDAIFSTPCDLSSYRFLLDRIAHVAVIGEPPPAALDEQLRDILADGEPAALPRGVLVVLTERRRQLSRGASWTEGHVRPVPPKAPDDPARDGGSRR